MLANRTARENTVNTVGRRRRGSPVSSARELSEFDQIGEAATLAAGLRAALLALEASSAECRLAMPYAPLRLVLDVNGLRWCCSHDPEHSLEIRSGYLETT
jgi:hypothetical protein